MTRPHPRARLRRSNQIEFAAYLVLAVAVAIVVVFILLDVLDQVLPLPRILVLALGILVVLAAGIGVLALLSIRARRKIGGLRTRYPDALVWWITPADSFGPALHRLGGPECERRELAEGLALVVEPNRLRFFQTERADTRLVLELPGDAVAEIRTVRVTAGMVRRAGIVLAVHDASGERQELGFLGAHDVLPAYLSGNGTYDLAAEVRRSLALSR
ncbi:hypothetical protein D9V32_06715 [Mycetocola tolaasinivorans]|uniref:DUF2550 family protein n=1 Tax=Mycetocola tolaasinivorans TaxID=76635 RepID=A0A3L7A8N9_9MICO|nr:hypothetical protein [Mycetocola tolaasinivorans]RLP76537.1 hypothetical protein D9V32_06715 [Mycetocola tolaasinivorans]